MKFFQIPILLLLVSSFFFPSVYANEFEDRAEALSTKQASLAEAANEGDEISRATAQAKLLMVNRQLDVFNSYVSVKARVDALITDDAKKTGATTLVENTEPLVLSFMKLNVDNQIDEVTLEPSSDFNEKESEALSGDDDNNSGVSRINIYLLSPSRPGRIAGDDESGVPDGDLLEDFIPGIIRILFRFASLAVLVSFVTSGIMFVMAFSNDERISKAKSMLYYSLIGFAFVTLAFAIIKAVTDIDFFGFI